MLNRLNPQEECQLALCHFVRMVFGREPNTSVNCEHVSVNPTRLSPKEPTVCLQCRCSSSRLSAVDVNDVLIRSVPSFVPGVLQVPQRDHAHVRWPEQQQGTLERAG